MAETKHHPSCKENDKFLAYHCNQCGLDEYVADDIESLISSRLSEMRGALDAARELAQWCYEDDMVAIGIQAKAEEFLLKLKELTAGREGGATQAPGEGG